MNRTQPYIVLKPAPQHAECAWRMHLAQPWWHPVAAVAPYSGLTPSASRPGVMKRCAAPPNSTPESQAFIVPPQCRHHVCVLCLKETFTSPGQYAPALTLQCMEIHKLEHFAVAGQQDLRDLPAALQGGVYRPAWQARTCSHGTCCRQSERSHDHAAVAHTGFSVAALPGLPLQPPLSKATSASDI